MTQKTDFKKAFGNALKAMRFLKKGQSWFLEGKDSVVVLNLQKSDFDTKYFVNLGIWLKSLGAADFPSENRCHIQARLTSLFPERAEMIDGACDMSAEGRDLTSFLDFLEGQVVPLCVDCLHIENLRSRLERGDFKRALVMKAAKDVLKLEAA